ncbi:hypothetical protein ElyMa_001134500 [Elysia marginata]|uniref:Uncharacterized protein n=1 Tax=Elysia marginata TaxID=1093978 RepID=A0AAV4I062_9GAST|nr:hypothetical protein ElyMa_001134500 [Elysia marginata]
MVSGKRSKSTLVTIYNGFASLVVTSHNTSVGEAATESVRQTNALQSDRSNGVLILQLVPDLSHLCLEDTLPWSLPGLDLGTLKALLSLSSRVES